jgi:predicted NACHT family NTPase
MSDFVNLLLHPPNIIYTALILPVGYVAARIIKRFIGDSSSYLLNGVLFFVTRVFYRSAAAKLTLQRYAVLELSADSNRKIKIPSARDVFLNIDDIFVPLYLDQSASNTQYTNTNLLDAGNRIRIIGDPGSGKSTIAKKLFRDECRKVAQFKLRGKARMPIIVELKNLKPPKRLSLSKRGEWLLNDIRATLTGYNVYNINKCFDTFSKEGLLLILDGLDEVASQNYPEVRDSINQLGELLEQNGKNNVVIVTLRSQFHQQVKDDFSIQYPAVLSLRRFTPTDIYMFLSRWPFAYKDRFDNILRIYTDLFNKPNLREMCTNPLVLSMYVALDQAAEGSVVPETRTAFYKVVTDELVIKRRSQQLKDYENLTAIKDLRYEVLGSIAISQEII